MASGSSLPLEGRVFISVSDAHKSEVAALAKRFADLGFKLSSTTGTAAVLAKAGLEVESVPKLAEGRPNTLDLLKNNEIQLVINTPSGQAPRADEIKIRTTAIYTNTPIMTTIGSAKGCRRRHRRAETKRLRRPATSGIPVNRPSAWPELPRIRFFAAFVLFAVK